MFSMFRTGTILLIVATATSVFAQTPPPGAPFDPSKHPNPIVTFVESKDFKPLANVQMQAEEGIDLLGLCQEQGKVESLEVAPGRFVKNMSILNFRTYVT